MVVVFSCKKKGWPTALSIFCRLHSLRVSEQHRALVFMSWRTALRGTHTVDLNALTMWFVMWVSIDAAVWSGKPWQLPSVRL